MSNGPQIFFNGILGSSAEAFSTKSLEFDGVDDYVSISNGSAVNITGNGSISFWINAATLASYTGIVSKVENTASVVSNAQYHIGMLSNGVRCVITGTDLKIGSEDVGTVPTITTGVWEHYVLTWDGSNLSLYKNGVFAASKTQVSNPSTNTEPVLIGYRNGYDYVDGKIDEVSIFNTVLSAGDVTSMYNSGQPTDLTSLSPVAWYRMGENSTFSSQILMPENTNKDKVSNYSFAFDGVSAEINCGADSSLQPTSSITLSAWFLIPSGSLHYGADTLISQDHVPWGNLFKGYYIEVSIASNGYLYYAFSLGNGTAETRVTGATNSGGGAPYVGDTWYNLVGTWDGSDMNLYINGVSLGTTAFSGPIAYEASEENWIGNRGRGVADYFVGSIDEVSIFNSAKAIGDIWDGTGKPTDLTGQSGLVSWWRMGEDATFSTNWTIPDQIGSNNGTSANMTIEDRTGDAPDSSNNALSYNMVEADIVEETP